MSSEEPDAFPLFAKGDVVIELSATRRYRLHSGTLKAASTFFAAQLVDENVIALSRKAVKFGKAVRWLFRLSNEATEDDGTGRLETMVRT